MAVVDLERECADFLQLGVWNLLAAQGVVVPGLQCRNGAPINKRCNWKMRFNPVRPCLVCNVKIAKETSSAWRCHHHCCSKVCDQCFTTAVVLANKEMMKLPASQEPLLPQYTQGFTEKQFLFMGNPGSGKSTLLNSLVGAAEFKAGVSVGQGLTRETRRHSMKGQGVFLDTPGVDDVSGKKEIASELLDALSTGGTYCIFFVVNLCAGRISPADLTTMRVVLEALQRIDGVQFSIIINKIERKTFQKPGFADRVAEYLNAELRCPADGIHFVPMCHEVHDSEDQMLSELDLTDLQVFVDKAPVFRVLPALVTHIKYGKYVGGNVDLSAMCEDAQVQATAMSSKANDLRHQWAIKNASAQAAQDDSERATERLEKANAEAAFERGQVIKHEERRRQKLKRGVELEKTVIRASHFTRKSSAQLGNAMGDGGSAVKTLGHHVTEGAYKAHQATLRGSTHLRNVVEEYRSKA